MDAHVRSMRTNTLASSSQLYTGSGRSPGQALLASLVEALEVSLWVRLEAGAGDALAVATRRLHHPAAAATGARLPCTAAASMTGGVAGALSSSPGAASLSSAAPAPGAAAPAATSTPLASASAALPTPSASSSLATQCLSTLS